MNKIPKFSGQGLYMLAPQTIADTPYRAPGWPPPIKNSAYTSVCEPEEITQSLMHRDFATVAEPSTTP